MQYIVNQDVYTYIKPKLKARKGETVTLIRDCGHVLLVVNQYGDKFSILASLVTPKQKQ